jgi:signal transduction histidine kinase
MPIDWLQKLRALFQTLAFCLAVSAILFGFASQQPYEVSLVYSVCIGTCTWAGIDFGRNLFASSRLTGWPQGPAQFLLPAVGILLGYGVGTTLADLWFGRSSWDTTARDQLPGSLVVSLVISGIITFIFYSRNKGAYLEQMAKEAGLQASEARLRLLETQLEPHMLFNTLANLRVLIRADPVRAQAMLDCMVAYLRATLDASRASSHTLENEFARLQDYLELMAIRMGPRLQFTLDLPDTLRQQAVPPLLLQPLVENSIQHGLEPKVEGGSITVSARREGNTLMLQVEDTGRGWNADTAPASSGSGFGLAQVRERLATTFGTTAAILLVAVPAGGTRASITFPCKP